MTDTPPGTAPRSSTAAGVLVAASIGIGALLRALEVRGKSLWLDEVHSIWTAQGSGFAGVVERVRLDLHPPLYFLLLHAAEGVPGLRDLARADPHALRWLSVLFSLATLVPLLSLARAAGLSPLARAVACGLFCTSPYQVLYGAELRAYSALGLCAVTAAWAAFTDRAPAWVRFLVFTAATGIGMHVHYFTAVAAVVILAARPLYRAASASDGELRIGDVLPWRRLAMAAAIGFALFLPWLLVKESWLFTNPSKLWRPEIVPETGAPMRHPARALVLGDLMKAASIPLRSYVPMVGSLGPGISALAKAAASAFFGLTFAGGAVLLARRRRGGSLPGGARLWALIAAGTLAYVPLVIVCLVAWRHVPTQYFVIGAWIWPLACAAFVDAIETPQARKAYAALLLLASLALGICQVLGAPRENLRGAVDLAVAIHAREGAIPSAVLWQPLWYPYALPYDVYAPGVPALEPADVPPASASERRSVVLITRGVALSGARAPRTILKQICAGRRLTRNYWLDDMLRVAVYEAK